MSSENKILVVDEISKLFKLYSSPQQRLQQSLLNKARSLVGAQEQMLYKEFWALRDISFDVGRGETVGIVGRNGAGKSTLLQIIVGTLPPTSGKVAINGKISALLELGAGFNPEFTGRDNVMLSGAILGLTREQMLEKFDDILSFADIGQFIDQPVKTYSSGMYVRLAFSVASHVDPDLLVVDEALAVGDSVFQAKCMNRIRRMMDDGLSLLFVSHDISAVKSLCDKAVLLDQGRLLSFDETPAVANLYTKVVHESKSGEEPAVFDQAASIERMGDKKAEYLSVQVTDTNGRPRETFLHGETIAITSTVVLHQDATMLGLGLHIRDRTGADVAYNDNLLEQKFVKDVKQGQVYKLTWHLPCIFVRGRYDVAVVISMPGSDATPYSEIGEDFVICDFITVAAQFGVGGDWNIYGNLRLGTLEKIQFITQDNPAEAAETAEEESHQLTEVAGNANLRLHLACGGNLLEGWINVDAYGSAKVYRWDLSEGLPFADNSVDFIFTEHFLEHLTKAEGASFLLECHRVLALGGVLRLSTPSLSYLVDRYQAGELETWAPVGWVVNEGADLVNESLRNWGHQYIYDHPALVNAFLRAGFAEQQISRKEWHNSEHPELRGLECRPYFEDLIYEGTKA